MPQYEAVQYRSLGNCWRDDRRIAKSFPEFCQAERYARRILGQRPGVPVDIYEQEPTATGGLTYDRVATVSRDALGRTWTDGLTMEGLI
jgi:hypothetical protein